MNWTDFGIGVGALAIAAVVITFGVFLIKSFLRKNNYLNAKEAEINKRMDSIEEIVVENKNMLATTDNSRNAYKQLDLLRTDNVDVLRMEAMKAKAAKKKLSAKKIVKTQRARLD